MSGMINLAPATLVAEIAKLLQNATPSKRDM
jgi:hypothetical protein